MFIERKPIFVDKKVCISMPANAASGRPEGAFCIRYTGTLKSHHDVDSIVSIARDRGSTTKLTPMERAWVADCPYEKLAEMLGDKLKLLIPD